MARHISKIINLLFALLLLKCKWWTDLSTGEWLDFVRALYKSGADRLEKKYGEPLPNNDWSDENWAEFKKIMKNVDAKIWQKMKKEGAGKVRY